MNNEIQKNVGNMISSKVIIGFGLAMSSVGCMYFPLRYLMIRKLKKRQGESQGVGITGELRATQEVEALDDTFAILLGSVSFIIFGELLKIMKK